MVSPSEIPTTLPAKASEMGNETEGAACRGTAKGRELD